MGLFDRLIRRLGGVPASEMAELKEEVARLKARRSEVPEPIGALAEPGGMTWGLDLPDADAHLDAMQKSAVVYGCVDRIGKKVASARRRLFRRARDAKGQLTLEEVPEHPVLDLLAQVNPWTTAWEFGYQRSVDLDLTGNSFWFKVRRRMRFAGIDVSSPPVELWRLPPEAVEIQTSARGFIARYMLRVNGKEIPMQVEDVLHYKYPNPLDPWRGLSPLQAATLAVSQDYLASRWALSTLKKGGRLSGIISPADKDVTLDERQIKLIDAQWRQKHGGSDNAGNWAIVPAALKVDRFSLTPQEMDFLGLRRFDREEIAAIIYGVPLSKLGITEQVNRSNMEESDVTFLRDTIAPRLQLVAERDTEFLLHADFGATDLVLIPDDLVADDIDLQSRVDQRYLQEDVITINEVRTRRNLGDPVPWGDQPRSERLLRRFSDEDGGDQDQDDGDGGDDGGPEGDGDDDDEGKGLRAKVAAATRVRQVSDAMRGQQHLEFLAPREGKFARRLRRLFQAQQREVLEKVRALAEHERSVKDHLDPTDRGPLDVEALLFETEAAEREFADAARPIMAETLQAAGELALRELEVGISFSLTDPEVARFLQGKVFRFAREVNQTTKEALRETLLEGWQAGETIPELAARVNKVFDEAKGFRSITIARTELNSAANGGTFMGWKQSGVVEKKRWISTHDNRTRRPPESNFNHVAADGEEVPLNSPFMRTGQPMMFPGDPDGHVGNIANCFIDHQVPIFTVNGWKPIGKIEVGDLVLTHRGRFRPVTRLLAPTKYDGEVVKVTYAVPSGRQYSITVTPEHPILTDKGWVPAGQVAVGDVSRVAGIPCPECGVMMPLWNTYCSLSCNSKVNARRQWSDPEHRANISAKTRAQMLREYAGGKRDGRQITQAAHQRVRELTTAGEFWVQNQSPEQNEERKRKRRLALNGSEATLKTAMVSPAEDAFARAFSNAGIDYVRQALIGERYFVDFFLPDLGVIVEVDGPIHDMPVNKKRDAERDAFFLSLGYTVFHYRDHQVNRAVNDLSRLALNHSGQYGSLACAVVKVERWTLKKARRLYNFAVDEDESYVANGVIVHNCRCTMAPVVKE